MTAWRVVKVFQGSALDVALRMRTGGVEAYCPAYTTRRRCRYGRRGQIVEHERALFPSYLFARVGDGFRVEAFERARCKLIVFRKAVLSDAQIDAVRSTAFMVSAISDCTQVVPGALVEFWRGVLAGARADVLKIRGQRAVVAMLGSGKVLRVDINDLETVSRAPIEAERVAI